MIWVGTSSRINGAAEMREPLLCPKSWDVADQCREMGLLIGDTIEGREDYANGGYSVARLKLLWIGRTEAVCEFSTMTDRKPEWSDPEEAANWTLECRKWYRISRENESP